MRNFKILVLIVLSLLVTNSCYDNEGITNPESRVVEARGVTLKFGRYFGKCQGNRCVEIFLLQEFVLKEDSSDQLPVFGEYYKGKFVGFKGANIIDTERLLLEFPNDLLNSKLNYSIIGQPDAGDWGGIYVEYEDYKHHKQFLIDLNTNNIPKYLKSYVYLIDEKINEIGDVNNQN